MLDRQHGHYEFACDGGRETLETGERDFERARAALERAGWTLRKSGGEWLHLCPACARVDPRQQSLQL